MDILAETLRTKRSIILLITVGTLSWTLTMVKSGLCWGGDCLNGLGFWGPNGHDGVWHIAIIKSLSRGNFEMPIFPPEMIKNYHIGFDLLVSIIHKVTFLPISILYFQILPILLALGIGIGAHLFVSRWMRANKYSPWVLFFVYFGGSLGWLVNLVRGNGFDGESMFWSQQSISTLINPPFALSLVIIFVGLWMLLIGLEGKGRHNLFFATIFFGVLIQIKAYAGVLVLISLLVSGIYLILSKQDLRIIRVFMGTLIISLLLFLPMNSSSSSVIEIRPFWFIQTLFEFPDRFHWVRMASAIANYKLAQQWLNYVLVITAGIGLFIVGNFAIRVVSMVYFVRKWRKMDWVDVFIGTLILAGIMIPTVFVQAGTTWNTIQFMYYSLMFSAVVSGIYITKLIGRFNSRGVRVAIGLIIILLTIPTSLATLWLHYLPLRPPAMISSQELEALEFLSRQPQGVVLTQPFDPKKALEAQSNPPRPLHLYESTSYVSAYSNKSVYLEDEINLNITGYDWRARKMLVEDFFHGEGNLLPNENIEYLYLHADVDSNIDLKGSVVIFRNNEVVILRL